MEIMFLLFCLITGVQIEDLVQRLIFHAVIWLTDTSSLKEPSLSFFSLH
jgi:hypothetical protein